MQKKKLIRPQRHSIITIGTFDGVHVGHKKILERLISVGKQKNLKPTVLTFFPHPRMVLQPNFKMELLNTLEEKKEILENLGIEEIVVKPFNKEFAELSAKEYVENILVQELGAKHIIIGYDHRFGKNRSANIDDLKTLGHEIGFEVEEIQAQDIEDITVSSTKIRKALQEGNLEIANSYLGYPYFLNGTIVKGKGLGKTIDFPTANLNIKEDYKLIPKQGVYVVKSVIEGVVVRGMMNIGTNPTVNGNKESIEVHFFDFSNDIYGKSLKIEMLNRLRDEQKFESLQALGHQLGIDKENALAFFKTLN